MFCGNSDSPFLSQLPTTSFGLTKSELFAVRQHDTRGSVEVIHRVNSDNAFRIDVPVNAVCGYEFDEDCHGDLAVFVGRTPSAGDDMMARSAARRKRQETGRPRPCISRCSDQYHTMIKHGQEVIDGLDRIVTATEKAAARAFWIATPAIWETIEARADPFNTACIPFAL